MYDRSQNCKTGGPIWKEHWGETQIVDETSRSWITSWGEKIPKKGGHGICFSQDELDKLVWINENFRKISEQIYSCKDFTKLKAIKNILEG